MFSQIRSDRDTLSLRRLLATSHDLTKWQGSKGTPQEMVLFQGNLGW